MDLAELKDLVGRDGKIFSVVFTKRTDGTERKMVARIGVRKDQASGDRNWHPDDHGLLAVYDMQSRGYRHIPAESIQEVTVRGKRHLFRRRVS